MKLWVGLGGIFDGFDQFIDSVSIEIVSGGQEFGRRCSPYLRANIGGLSDEGCHSSGGPVKHIEKEGD